MNRRSTLNTIVTTFFLVCIESTAFGQITGTIVDKDTKTPLPFTSIQVVDKPYGAVANSEGEFNLSGEISPTDTLAFSHIGYTTVKCLPGELIGLNTVIGLKSAPLELSEVVILPEEYLENPRQIVKSAISRIAENHNEEPYILLAFYRHVNREDDEYKRLMEAAITISDKGYSTNQVSFDVTQIRKSYDFRNSQNKKVGDLWSLLVSAEEQSDSFKKILKNTTPDLLSDTTRASSDDLLKWEQDHYSLSLPGFYETNYTRQYLKPEDFRGYGALNTAFVREHSFKLDTITSFDGDLVYAIKILPSNRSKKYLDESRSLIIPVGKLFIRTRDFAILKMEYNYILNPHKKGSNDYNFYFHTRGGGILFKSIAQYKEFEGKMYLSYLYRAQNDPLAFSLVKKQESNYQKGHFYLERELLITQIITDRQAIEDMSQSLKWDSQLYKKKPAYNESFWKNYTVIKETPLQEKLRQDLEQKLTLDEQFREVE